MSSILPAQAVPTPRTDGVRSARTRVLRVLAIAVFLIASLGLASAVFPSYLGTRYHAVAWHLASNELSLPRKYSLATALHNDVSLADFHLVPLANGQVRADLEFNVRTPPYPISAPDLGSIDAAERYSKLKSVLQTRVREQLFLQASLTGWHVIKTAGAIDPLKINAAVLAGNQPEESRNPDKTPEQSNQAVVGSSATVHQEPSLRGLPHLIFQILAGGVWQVAGMGLMVFAFRQLRSRSWAGFLVSLLCSGLVLVMSQAVLVSLLV